jgi:anaerobic selenocysteine-containing dehydrogenase
MSDADPNPWKPTACGLCYANCGILVQTGGEDDRRILRVKGDKIHPASRGYTCNKALKIDYYVHGRDRLTAPLRRRADGSFEEID